MPTTPAARFSETLNLRTATHSVAIAVKAAIAASVIFAANHPPSPIGIDKSNGSNGSCGLIR